MDVVIIVYWWFSFDNVYWEHSWVRCTDHILCKELTNTINSVDDLSISITFQLPCIINLQTKEIWFTKSSLSCCFPFVELENWYPVLSDLHYCWCCFDDCCTHWRAKNDNTSSNKKAISCIHEQGLKEGPRNTTLQKFRRNK